MYLIKKGNLKEQLPNTWYMSKGQVMIKCPKCGKIAGLDDHVINPVGKNGEVSPSLVCPNDKCNFHEYVELEDWHNA